MGQLNTTAFDAAVAETVDEATQTGTLDEGIEAILAGAKDAQKEAVDEAVKDALAKDDSDHQAILDAAAAAIDGAHTVFVANRQKLAAAALANTPSAPPSAPPAV